MRPLAYIRAPEFVHKAVAVHRDPHDLLRDEGEVLDAVGGVGGQRPGKGVQAGDEWGHMELGMESGTPIGGVGGQRPGGCRQRGKDTWSWM